MKETYQHETYDNQIIRAAQHVNYLNQIYYNTHNQVVITYSKPTDVEYLLWNVLHESMELGLIQQDRFKLSESADKYEHNNSLELDVYDIDSELSTLKTIEQVWDCLGERNCNIFVGGSAEISPRSSDKSLMESNVRSITDMIADNKGILLNGGLGRDKSIMRIAVTNYLKRGGLGYIAVLPEEYVQYELPELQKLRESFGQKVQWIIIEEGDQRIALMNAILSAKKDTRFVVSGAGLGTLDELLKLIYLNQKDQQFLTILNSTQFSKALMKLLTTIGVSKIDNYTIYP